MKSLDQLKPQFTYKKEVVILNQNLIAKQELTFEEVKTIIRLHKKRIDIENNIFVQTNPKRKLVLLKKWEEIQFQLQDAWKFPRIQGKHVFWRMKGCTCPKIDNDDNWTNNGPYFYNSACPIHGIMVENIKKNNKKDKVNS